MAFFYAFFSQNINHRPIAGGEEAVSKVRQSFCL
jgi:hypothetical protein